MPRASGALVTLTSFGVLACLRLEEPPPFVDNGEPCASDSVCQPTSVCEFDGAVSQRVCRVRDGCTSHAECGADAACAFGACGPTECTNDASCGFYACQLAIRQCFEECANDTACASGAVCRDGQCLSATCTSATAARVCNGAACYDGVCVSAVDCRDYGCASGYTCESVQCVRHCTSDDECAGYACDTAFGECNESCLDESDCQVGHFCESFFCKPAPP